MFYFMMHSTQFIYGYMELSVSLNKLTYANINSYEFCCVFCSFFVSCCQLTGMFLGCWVVLCGLFFFGGVCCWGFFLGGGLVFWVVFFCK